MVVWCVCASAETLSIETFDNRPTGNLKAGDFDYISNDGNWYNSLGSSFIQVVEQQLSFDGYCASTEGKAAQFSGNHGKDFIINKKFATGGKVYMSFLLRVNTLKTGSGAKGNSNLIAALWTDLNSNAAGNLYNQVKIMTVDESHFQLGIAKRTETAQFAETQLETGKTYLVVSEYVYKDEVDSVFLYINPSKENKVPAQAAKVSLASAQTDAQGFYGMVLASNGNTPSDMLIDEIRVANFWDNLFGEEGDDPTPQDEPEIIADEKVVLGEADGHTYSDKEYARTLEIAGAHLNAVISISHTNDLIQLSTTELPKQGGSLTVSLSKPEKSGAQSDTITFTSGVTSAKTVILWDNIRVKPAEGTALLRNGSFEEYNVSSNPFLGEQTNFDDWAWSAYGAKAETSDVLDGSAAMHVVPTVNNGTLDQQVTVSEEYEAGDIFHLTFHYKAKDLKGGTLALDCYWEPTPGGDAEKMKKHDADKLQVVLAGEANNEWVEHKVATYKPVGARYFRVRLVVSAKNADVLFDQFSLIQSGHTDPENPDVPVDPVDPETPDTWTQDFNWDMSNPRALLIEPFDAVSHNKPIVLDGWQNVAAADQRPWWGFDASQTQILEDDGKFAKATAYQFGKETTGNWEMWLVTPPLDFKNAGSKVFTFSVMGQYLPEESAESKLEIYYIDASNPSDIFFDNLTSSFDIPSTSDMNESWRTFFLDLAPFSENIPDVFFMAFRFVGPNGNEGAVTYYLDNVSWGRTDLPTISVDVPQIAETAILNEVTIVGQITVSTKNLTVPVKVAIKGANYNKFKLSSETIPAEGGALVVGFQSDQEGVHEAYVELSSSEAATVYIPISVLCQAAEGIEDVQGDHVQSTKLIREGQLFIIRDGKIYNAQGKRVTMQVD